MTIEKKNPNATTVTASSNAITEINDRINAEETANHGHSTFVLSGSSDTLTEAEFWDGGIITLTESSPAPSSAFTLNVPANKRGIVNFVNATTAEVTITISGQSATAPTLPPKSTHASLTGLPGQEASLRCDATNVRWAGIPSFAMSAAEYAALSTVDARAEYITL